MFTHEGGGAGVEGRGGLPRDVDGKLTWFRVGSLPRDGCRDLTSVGKHA